MRITNGQKFLLTLSMISVFADSALAERDYSLDTLTAELENIVIIGSRSGGRSITDSAVPIDFVTQEQIRATGQTELGRAIQALIPSFNFSSSTISDGTDSVRPATLKGMSPDQVLVLINGKRRHTSALIHINTSVGRGTAGTDINAIPISAIDHIEVLRDGASAQYGSDAVAGVINIALKNSDEGTFLSSFGQTYEGDGEQFTLSANKGVQIGNDGIMHAAVEYRDRKPTNRAGLSGAVQYPVTRTCVLRECTSSQLPNLAQLKSSYAPDTHVIINDPGDREKNFNRRNFRIGDARSQQVSAIVNVEKPIDTLSSGAELYSFADLSWRENESGGFYRRANQLDRNPIGSRYPDGFLPLIETTIWDFSFGSGVQGEFDNGVSYDLSARHGRNIFDFSIKNSHNASWVSCHLDPSGCNNFASDTFSTATPTSADAGELELQLATVNFDFSLPVPEWDTNLSWGAEYKLDNYQITAGEPYSYEDYDGKGGGSAGIQVFPGFKPENEVDESRHAYAAYLDSEIQLTDWLLISPAARYEYYSDFGDTLNGKLAAKLDATDWLSLRGSVSSGFRAPAMQQLYFNNVSTQFIENIAFEVGTYRNDSALAKALGIPELTEETSTSWSVGFIVEPVPSFTLTTDFYYIEVDDRIVLSGQVSANDNDLPANVRQQLNNQGVGSALFFMNAVDTKTHGMDAVASWDVPFIPTGDLSLDFTGSISQTKVRSVKLPANLPASLFTKQDRSIIEEWQPDSHFMISGNYSLNDLTLMAGVHRYGEYSVIDGSEEQTYEAEYLTDVQLLYNFGKFGIFKIGANNLFNVTPDRNNIGQARSGKIIDSNGNLVVDSDGVFQYSRRSAPFGFNGGFYYASFEYNF